MARHILQLARVGKWGRDAAELTKQDFSEVLETFQGRRPATIGHPEGQTAPKFGDVESVRLSDDGTTLIGTVNLLAEAEQLYADGMYNGWSVGVPRRGIDNKRYLHHLAFLGATPPKIPGLKELPTETLTYSEGECADTYSFGGHITEVESMTDAEKKELEEAKAKAAALEKENEELKKKSAGSAAPTAGDKKNFADINLNEGAEDAKFADMEKQLEVLKASEKKSRLDGFSGKTGTAIPAGLVSKVSSIATLLADCPACEFADGDTTKTSPALDAFADILLAAFRQGKGLTTSIYNPQGDAFADCKAPDGTSADWGKLAGNI